MAHHARTADLLGGRNVLGADIHSGIDLVALIRAGLPSAAVSHLLNTGWLTRGDLARLNLPDPRQVNKLTVQQSNRLVRIARVLVAAEEVFDTAGKAQQWLRRPTPVLAGECPLDLLESGAGSRAVETLLGRISSGIAA